MECPGADFFNSPLHGGDDLFAAVQCPHRAGNRGDVSVNIAKRFGSETKKTGAGFQNLTDGFFLVGNGGNDQVRLSGEDFRGGGCEIRGGVVGV